MLEGLLSLLIQSEVSRADIEIREKVDSYYVVNKPAETYKYNVTYDISSRGVIKGDLNEFARIV